MNLSERLTSVSNRRIARALTANAYYKKGGMLADTPGMEHQYFGISWKPEARRTCLFCLDLLVLDHRRLMGDPGIVAESARAKQSGKSKPTTYRL